MSQLSLFDKQLSVKKRQYRYDPVAMSLARKGRRPWNKGLNARIDERVRLSSEKSGKTLKQSHKEGKIKVWCEGIKIDKEKYPNFGHQKKHSEETKKRIGEAKRKNPSRYWKGKKLSEETKRKLSEKHKALGKKPPSRNGTKSSEETRLKQSKALKGKPGGFLGGKHTEEAKNKIGAAFKGEKHHNWKGGITPLVMQIRACSKYKIWRNQIFERDNFTCQTCDKRGGHIEADHFPKLFSEIFKSNKIKILAEALECPEFWDISNGRTLCRKCHDKTKWKKQKEEVLQFA